MTRTTAIAIGVVSSVLPLLRATAQQIDVRPMPPQGCMATPTADSTVYDLEETTPAPQLRSFPPLAYPVALREAGVNGQVTVAYVVNADGRVDTTNVVVMAATDSAFIAAARAAVVGSRFWPGCRAGIPVRAQVTQQFRFEAKNYTRDGLLIPPKRGG